MTEITDKAKPGKITCIAVRRIGVEGHTSIRGFQDMVEVGEKVELPRDLASKFQDIGAIKVKI